MRLLKQLFLKNGKKFVSDRQRRFTQKLGGFQGDVRREIAVRFISGGFELYGREIQIRGIIFFKRFLKLLF